MIGTADDGGNEVPTCEQCKAPLTWRDRFYVPAGRGLCKRCHQHARRHQPLKYISIAGKPVRSGR